jgi:glycerate 2-kinase
MRILVAPDSFKESMTAEQAAQAVACGLRRALGQAVEIDICPVADGGEGTVDAMVAATRGRLCTTRVTGPEGEPVTARWGLLGGGAGAILEMAQAAGLHLVPPARRNPARTTTYGVGELIIAALDCGVRKIIVGIGGSATNDGGIGMAQALGVRFETAASAQPRAPLAGDALASLRAVDMSSCDSRLALSQIIVACDVVNPLYGPHGAACTYGPQKGATGEQVESLDEGLRHLASLLPAVDPEARGMGAAGGLGFGLVAFCGARLMRGVELVLDALSFRQRVRGCDLVITGEGRLDGQSVQGKACIGVARAAAAEGVRTVALVGVAGPQAEQTLQNGLWAYHALVDESGGVSVEQAMRHGPELLEALAAKVAAKLDIPPPGS